MARALFVFDFDHTLVDDNTDTWVMKLRPDLGLEKRLRDLRRQFSCWTDLMDHIFAELHEAGCGREEVLEHMGRLTVYDQALLAFRAVGECVWADTIIVSDSNSVFIDCILQQCGVEGIPKEILTNPAYFDSSERLHVRWFHTHCCPTCTTSPNMCKGTILSDFLSQQHEPYGCVVYVGDGRGDYCPCLKMTDRDTIVCRTGYSLATMIAKAPTAVTASVNTVNFTQSLGDFLVGYCLQKDTKPS